jgi:tRNA pseudouridine32 synthase/23S rRNA pseudouridine746 synthase
VSESTWTIDTFIAPVCNEDIEVLYQDDSILLINKPSGLLSLSGKNPLNKDSVHFRLVQDFPSANLVHRLDFGTSGIMLVALNKAVNGELTKQFQERQVSKTYTALLHGHMKEDSGTIDFPIAKDKPNFPLMKICLETGKPAVSEYVVLERLSNPDLLNPDISRVRFTPITGRTHQLRIHSQKIGHPIVGCDLYGLSDDDAAAPLMDRLMLHATTLAFTHPVSGQRMEMECAPSFKALKINLAGSNYESG